MDGTSQDQAIARRIALKSPGGGFDYPVFVERMLVAEGERVAAGRPFAIVVSARQRRQVLAAPMDGEIAEIRHGYGATLGRQEVLAILETFAPVQKPPRRPPASSPPERSREPGPVEAEAPRRARQGGTDASERPARDAPKPPPSPLAQRRRSGRRARDVLWVATPGFSSVVERDGTAERGGARLAVSAVVAAVALALAFLLAANAGYALPHHQPAILSVPIALTIGTLMALTVQFHARTRLGRRIGETALGVGMGAILVVAMHGMFYLASAPGLVELKDLIEIEPLVRAIRGAVAA
ncbi:MAG: hypothetical protein AAF371_07700 [Pseudomonadota bacterium]